MCEWKNGIVTLAQIEMILYLNDTQLCMMRALLNLLNNTIKSPLFIYFFEMCFFIDINDSWSVSQKKIELPIKNRKILFIFA